MTLDDFLLKYRHRAIGLVMEATVIDHRLHRQKLVQDIERLLNEMFLDMAVPPGRVPEEILTGARALFTAIEKHSPRPPAEKKPTANGKETAKP